ncbi:TonB-dependent receptor [Gilvimarinus sp. F26214L]|uniref:TonB-dependent receptor n=1 Tax=Gilvimarinus sp. DZF01 TaxID=3461371 RepID=UPI0040465185
MTLDRIYLVFGLAYAVVGMGLGIVMAATHDHGQLVTHAHLLLVGSVLSILYGVIYRLWVSGVGLLPRLQFAGHQLGAVGMIGGLYLLYGNHAPPESVEPLLAGSSVLVLLSLLLVIAMVLKAAGLPGPLEQTPQTKAGRASY